MKQYNRYILSLFFVLIGACSYAQTLLETHPLWHKYESATDGRHRSKLFIYDSQPTSLKKRPVVIVMPGGSYTYLAINSEGHDVAKYFASKGIVSVVLRYRMGFYGAHYPHQIEDYRKAMDYLKENAERLSIDTTKIGTVGFSAGGHLSGCAAIEDNTNYRPAFAAMIYPVVTMKEPYAHKASRKHLLRGNVELIEKLSIEDKVTPDMPPIFLLHCKDDSTVKIEGSLIFASQLENKGVNCKVEIHQKGGHGFGVRPNNTSGAYGWPDRFIDWLNNNVF